jgi:hypothetical protein
VNAQAAILRILGAGGALLFAFFFMLTFWRPAWVETFAADFIKNEVASELHTRIDALAFEGASDALSRAAAAIYQKNQQQIDNYKADIEARIDQQIAACIAQLLKLDDTARARLARSLEQGRFDSVISLTAVNEKLIDVIQGNYLRVVGELKRDLRIFTATNGFCFLLLLLATFLRPESTKLLFAPALVLALAVLFCSYAYVFDQNWLLTIIYSDYLGFAYFGYLALAFLFLCDILLNQGRATARLAEATMGTAASVMPG